jgi:hypothetical protein
MQQPAHRLEGRAPLTKSAGAQRAALRVDVGVIACGCEHGDCWQALRSLGSRPRILQAQE